MSSTHVTMSFNITHILQHPLTSLSAVVVANYDEICRVKWVSEKKPIELLDYLHNICSTPPKQLTVRRERIEKHLSAEKTSIYTWNEMQCNYLFVDNNNVNVAREQQANMLHNPPTTSLNLVMYADNVSKRAERCRAVREEGESGERYSLFEQIG